MADDVTTIQTECRSSFAIEEANSLLGKLFQLLYMICDCHPLTIHEVQNVHDDYVSLF